MQKFKTRYHHDRPVSPSGGVSMTDQQYRSDCDINTILKRYAITGQIPASSSGVCGDFTNVGDFQQCLERINRAKMEFDALPSELRARFGNDPTSYVDFVLDPANVDECIKLGLRVRETKEDTPVDVLKRIEQSVTPKGAEQSNPVPPIAL